MKYLRLLIVSFLLVCLGCTGCGSGLANTPPELVRAQGRAAVSVAVDAWKIVATVCVEASDAAGDDRIREQCAKYLVPARTAIIAAATALDTKWNSQVACDLYKAVELVRLAAQDLNVPDPVIRVVNDAAILAKTVAGPTCSVVSTEDAGAAVPMPLTRGCHRDGGASCFN